MKNTAASVLAGLRNISKSSGAPFQQVLQQYAIERFLYRISKSTHAQGVVLKGALLLKTIGIQGARPTMDIDMLRVGTQESDQPRLVNSAGRKFEDHLCRSFLARNESAAVEFQEQDAYNEACTLVAVDEGMVLHDAGHVLCGKLDDVRALVCQMVLRPSECRPEQREIAYTFRAPVLSKLPIVDSEDKVFLDPDRLVHFASSCRVFR
jgi:hypothetical protein